MKSISFPNGHMLVNGIELTHFADGDDVVKFERMTDSVMYKVGADGHMIASHSPDKSGKCTVKMQATSPSNQYLNKLLLAQEAGTDSFVPCQVTFQDMHRRDVAAGINGCILRMPDFQRGKDNTGNDMEWVFVVERYDLLLGNPDFAAFASKAAEAAI